MAETQQQNIVLQAAKNLAEGIPPTNAQIEETIDRATEVIDQQKQTGTLDTNTQVIAQDLKRVLTDTQRLLEEKNRDEKMQTFLLEAKLAAEQMAREGASMDTGAIKGELQATGRSMRPLQDEALQVLQQIKSVIYEVMRSPSFRKALINSIDLFQQVFWEQWQDKGKQITEGLKSDLERGDSQMNATRQAASNAGEKAQDEARRGDIGAGSFDAEFRKQDLKRRFNELLREIGDNTEYRQAVSDLFELAGKMRSRVEKAGKRVKGVAKDASSENAHVTRMWEEGRLIIEEFTGHNRIKDLMDALTDLYEFIAEDKRATKFFDDLRHYIVEGLDNPKSLQVGNTIGSTSTTASVDDAYDRLYKEGRELFESEELRKRVRAVMDEFNGMIKTARRDPAAERLTNSARALMRDLTIDPKTNKPSLWILRDNIEKSGRSLLLPVLLRELEIVPVKGIRGSTSTYDYAVRNLVFSAYDLLPERARFYMDLDVDIDLSDIKRENWQGNPGASTDADINGEIVLRLDRIKTHVRDVEFHYLRKTFPQLEDWGRMDIDTQDNGCRLEVRWRIMSPRGGSAPTVVGYKVYCGIDGLQVTIKEAAKHSILDKMMSKLFAGQLKERVEREIERNLASFASKVSLLFNDVFQGKLPEMSSMLPAMSL